MDYKQTPIEGTSWVRAKDIIIKNGLGELPVITFHEEQILNIDSQLVRRPYIPPYPASPMLSEVLSDPELTFPLIDPVSQTEIGVASYGQLYLLVYSLYISLTTARDKAANDALVNQEAALFEQKV